MRQPANVEAEPNTRPKTPKAKEPKAAEPREGSKQAQLIAMLRRAKGATIDEIAEALVLAAAHGARRHRRRAEEEARARRDLGEGRQARSYLSDRGVKASPLTKL